MMPSHVVYRVLNNFLVFNEVPQVGPIGNTGVIQGSIPLVSSSVGYAPLRLRPLRIDNMAGPKRGLSKDS